MKEYEEDQIFKDKGIRDTSAHISSVSFCERWARKTILIENGLNQAASCQAQGSRDSAFTKSHAVGSALSVAATSNDYMTLTQHFPYIRIVATCSTAPTSGALNIYVEKQGV